MSNCPVSKAERVQAICARSRRSQGPRASEITTSRITALEDKGPSTAPTDTIIPGDDSAFSITEARMPF